MTRFDKEIILRRLAWIEADLQHIRATGNGSWTQTKGIKCTLAHLTTVRACVNAQKTEAGP